MEKNRRDEGIEKVDIVASCRGLVDPWKGTSVISGVAFSWGIGVSGSYGVSDSEERHSLLEESDRVRPGKENTELEVLEGEEPSLSTREGERDRLDLLSSEKGEV